MEQFEIYGCKINTCTDINEWATKFYGKTDEMIIDENQLLELNSECMGFAEPEANEIWIFLPKNFDDLDLETTIAHEIGHIFGDHVPIINKDNDDDHEKIADYFYQYYSIVKQIYQLLKK